MANDFSKDPFCRALYRFEPGALTVDSSPVGTNTLTDHGTVGESSGSLGTTHKEGSGCADFESSSTQYFSRADADLDPLFPLKNGDTVKQATICFRFKPETMPGASNYDHMVDKWDWSGGKISLALYLENSKFGVHWGYNTGTDNEVYQASRILYAGTWYWVGVAIDGINKSCTIRLYDYGVSSSYTYTHTYTNELRIVDTDFTIGGSYGGSDLYDGLIDEVYICNRVLSTTEMDTIRVGTFSYLFAGSGSLVKPTGDGYLYGSPWAAGTISPPTGYGEFQPWYAGAGELSPPTGTGELGISISMDGAGDFETFKGRTPIPMSSIIYSEASFKAFVGCGYFGAIGEGTIPSLSGAGVLDILLEIIGSGSIPGFRQPTSAEMQLITYILGAKNLASLTGAGLILLEEGLVGAGVFAQFVQASYGSGAPSGGAGRLSLSSRFSSYILKFARE